MSFPCICRGIRLLAVAVLLAGCSVPLRPDLARMYRVASEATEPATRQALDERLRLFEGGRGEMTTILAAFRRHLEAMHDVAQARHDHAVAIAMLTMAVGTRLPEDVR